MAGKAFERIGQNSSKEKMDDVRAGIEFAIALDYALEKTGKNQKYLADKLNKSQSEVSKWLSGFHNPTWGTIKKIEGALNYKILFTSKEVDEKQTEIQNFNYNYTLVGSIDKLSPNNFISAKSILPKAEKSFHLKNDPIRRGTKVVVTSGKMLVRGNTIMVYGKKQIESKK